MTFSYYAMFIHNVFISKRKAYQAFCLPIRTVSMAAVYQLTIKSDQDKFGAVYLDAFDIIKVCEAFLYNHVLNEHHIREFITKQLDILQL